MIQYAGAERVVECFCAVAFDNDGRARVGVIALGYCLGVRVEDLRKCIIVDGVVGRSEIAVARVLAWVRDQVRPEEMVCHVAGENLARQLEDALLGRGDDLAVLWMSFLQTETGVVPDRIDRPATPRLIEAAKIARKADPDLVLHSAFHVAE